MGNQSATAWLTLRGKALPDQTGELLAITRIRERVVEGAFGDAQGLGADSGPGAIEDRERDLEPRALIA